MGRRFELTFLLNPHHNSIALMESVNSTLLWRPTQSTISQANITLFSDRFRSRGDISFGSSYAELHAASLRHAGHGGHRSGLVVLFP